MQGKTETTQMTEKHKTRKQKVQKHQEHILTLQNENRKRLEKSNSTRRNLTIHSRRIKNTTKNI